MRVAIIGLGLIGGSLGLALRQARPELEVLGIARNEANAAAAVERGAITAGGTDPALAVAADLVVVATPLQEMRPVFARLGRSLPDRTVVTDVASVKGAVVDWARELLGSQRFLGGHPMAGKTERGLKAAEAGLFRGAPWIFTPAPGQDLTPFAAWFELVEAIGAHRELMSAADHDRRVALVSHLAFLVSAAYVSAVKASPEWTEAVRIAGPGFKDMVRLAGGDPDMYSGIASANREQLLKALARFEAAVGSYRRHLEQSDPRIWELFEESKRVHEQWGRG